MRILMIAPYLPYPPHAGGRIRMLELLRFLQPRHKVTLVAFIFSEKELPLVEEVSKVCERVIAVMRRKQPISKDDVRPRLIAEFWTLEMRDTLQILNRERQFDLVDVEHIFMAQYASLITAPSVLHEHNIESQVLRRYAELSKQHEENQQVVSTRGGAFRDAQTEWPKMATYESATWAMFPLRITVSDLDREEMFRRCPIGRIVMVPNGVDSRSLRPVGNPDSAGVLFTGTLDYQPNLDAAVELCDVIWPLVHQRVPMARLYIIGRKPPSELLMRYKPGQVEIVADVPDITPYAAKCCVSVVPLVVGGGTRIKILTSMALGLPVLTTSIGCEGLELRNGYHMLIANEPTHFAQSLVHLLLNREKRISLAREGRAIVEARYDWRQIFPALERLYEEVASQSVRLGD